MQKNRESYSTFERQILHKYEDLGMASTNLTKKNEQGHTMGELLAWCTEESGLTLIRVKVVHNNC